MVSLGSPSNHQGLSVHGLYRGQSGGQGHRVVHMGLGLHTGLPFTTCYYIDRIPDPGLKVRGIDLFSRGRFEGHNLRPVGG